MRDGNAPDPMQNIVRAEGSDISTPRCASSVVSPDKGIQTVVHLDDAKDREGLRSRMKRQMPVRGLAILDAARVLAVARCVGVNGL